jgi:hypothetical protein
MDAPATLVWIAPSPPDAEQARAVSSWGSSHGVRLVAPRDAATATLAIDPRIADDVEKFLDRARDAMAARDGDAVDRMLEAATSTLRAHPEVPQAAWLMAEVERARSTRLRRIAPIDEAAAASAWTRAEALDGGRVAGVGEQGASAPSAATLTLPAGLPAGATVRVDGSAASGPTVATRAGLHALVVELDGNPVWASWIEAPAGTSSAQIAAPLVPECSRMDVARASVAGETVDAAGVHCRSWIAAIAGEPDGVRVALCSADHCGPLAAWRAPLPWTYDPLGEGGKRGHDRGWPTWATWGLVGATAVVAAGVIVLATGALKPAPTETQFVSGGVRKQ